MSEAFRFPRTLDMSDTAVFPSAQRALVGQHVKVARHGERLWLKVKSVRPNGKMIAVLDNHPINWPQGFGDAVEIDADEILQVMR